MKKTTVLFFTIIGLGMMTGCSFKNKISDEVDEAKKAVAIDRTYTIIKKAEVFYTIRMIGEEPFQPITFTYVKNADGTFTETSSREGETLGSIDVSPDSGSITIDAKGNITLSKYFDVLGYCINLDQKTKIVTVINCP